MGFYHPANEVWYFDEKNEYFTVCNNSGEDPACSDSVKLWNEKDHWVYLNVTV